MWWRVLRHRKLSWIIWVGPKLSQVSLKIKEKGSRVSVLVSKENSTDLCWLWRGRKGTLKLRNTGPLEPPERKWLCQYLEWDSGQTSGSQNCTIIKLCHFKTLSLWDFFNFYFYRSYRKYTVTEYLAKVSTILWKCMNLPFFSKLSPDGFSIYWQSLLKSIITMVIAKQYCFISLM